MASMDSFNTKLDPIKWKHVTTVNVKMLPSKYSAKWLQCLTFCCSPTWSLLNECHSLYTDTVTAVGVFMIAVKIENWFQLIVLKATDRCRWKNNSFFFSSQDNSLCRCSQCTQERCFMDIQVLVLKKNKKKYTKVETKAWMCSWVQGRMWTTKDVDLFTKFRMRT